MMGKSDRFISLDIARGIAALAVVLSHWGHFLPKGTSFYSFPLGHSLAPIFKWGWVAVDFFFVLSGFIFFLLYSKSIENRTTSARSFFSNRFTRLYPLHFVTLIAVAALQLVYHNLNQEWFIYKTNDLKSFFLHLFFASQWGIYRPAGDSFNGPVWSVSIEILLYISFFAISLLRCNKISHTIIFIVIGIFSFWFMSRLGRGIMSFYVGGLVFHVYQKYDHILKKHPTAIIATLFVSWGVYLLLIANYDSISPAFGIEDRISKKFSDSFIVYIGSLVAFPILALTLVTFDRRFATAFKSIEFLGNISYSSYLIHFPLQLFIAILLPPTIENFYIFTSPFFLAAFMCSLIAISHLTFVYFEYPSQKKLRKLPIFSNKRG